MGIKQDIGIVLSSIAIAASGAEGAMAQDATQTPDTPSRQEILQSGAFGFPADVTKLALGDLVEQFDILGGNYFMTADAWRDYATPIIEENGGLSNLDATTFRTITHGIFNQDQATLDHENNFYSRLGFTSLDQIYSLYKLRTIAVNLSVHNPGYAYDLVHTRVNYRNSEGQQQSFVGGITIASNDPRFAAGETLESILAITPHLNLSRNSNTVLAQVTQRENLGDQSSFPLSRLINDSTVFNLSGLNMDPNDIFYRIDNEGEVVPVRMVGGIEDWYISRAPNLSVVLVEPSLMTTVTENLLEGEIGACAFLSNVRYRTAENMISADFDILFTAYNGQTFNYKVSLCSYQTSQPVEEPGLLSLLDSIGTSLPQGATIIKNDIQTRLSTDGNGLFINLPERGNIQIEGPMDGDNFANYLMIVSLLDTTAATQLNEEEFPWVPVIGWSILGLGGLALVGTGIYWKWNETKKEKIRKQEAILTAEISNISSKITHILNGDIFEDINSILEFEEEVTNFGGKIKKDPSYKDSTDLTQIEKRIANTVFESLPKQEDGTPIYLYEQVEQKVREIRAYNPKHPSQAKVNNIIRDSIETYFDEIRKDAEEIISDGNKSEKIKQDELLRLTREYEYHKASLIKHFLDKEIHDAKNFNNILTLTRGALNVPPENPEEILSTSTRISLPKTFKGNYRARSLKKEEFANPNEQMPNVVLRNVNEVGNHLISIMSGNSADIDKIKASHAVDSAGNLLPDSTATLREKTAEYISKAIAQRIADEDLPIFNNFLDKFTLKQNAEEIAREVYNFAAGIKSNKQEISRKTTFEDAFPYYAKRDLNQEVSRMNRKNQAQIQEFYYAYDPNDKNARSVNTSNTTRLYIAPIYKYNYDKKEGKYIKGEVVRYHMVAGPQTHNSAG
jgi:hypothetical protein